MLNPKKHIEQWGPLDASVLYVSFWWYECGPGIVKRWGLPWPELLAWYEHERVTFWWEQEEMQKRGEKAIRTWLLPERKFKHLWNSYKRLESEDRTFWKTFPARADEEIDKFTVKFFDYFVRYFSLTLVYEMANYAAPEFMRQKLMNTVSSQKMDHVLQILLAPEKLSFQQREELELLKKYVPSNNTTELRKKLAAHAKKWFWVENSYHEAKVLTAADFEHRLKGIRKQEAKRKIAVISKYISEVRKQKQQIIKNYKLSRSLAYAARRLSFSIWWQDLRKAHVWRDLELVRQVSQASARNHQIPFDNLLCYTADEWLELHKSGKKVTARALQTRKRGSILSITPHEYFFYDGAKARKTVAPFLNRTLVSDKTDSFPGIVVSKGRGSVTGIARVLVSPKGGNAFRPGEILVAPMTEPDYVPIMRKAKAVITDTGGLMSHAAVISRELGIPCLTGTKVATQVLKDGDRIKVDVEKGIVKIL